MKARCLIVFFVMMAFALHANAAPLDTAFSYQGKLTDSAGTPISGSRDLQFKLFDAVSEGNQIGDPVTLSDVNVTNGLFTVKLDFGPAAFAGEKRWLETKVGEETLWPRVEIASTPNAIFAQKVAWTGISDMPSAFPPNGTAGGELTGSYPNPLIADNVVTNTKIASDATSLSKVSGGTMVSRNGKIGIGNSSPTALFQVNAPMILDQQQTTGGITQPYWIWQSFQPSRSGQLMEIDANVTGWYAPNSTVRFSIYTGQGPYGPPLYQKDIPNFGNGSAPHFTVDLPVYVSLGETYTFSMIVLEGGGRLDFDITSGNPYLNGLCNGDPNLDAWFRVYIKSDPSMAALSVSSVNYVGVGTSWPSYPLHVNGQVMATQYLTLSDAQYKTNITSLPNALDQILKLKGVSYDWSVDAAKGSPRRQIGFLAQDMEKIFPELVSMDDKGVRAIAYQNLIPVLVEAIKGQQRRMEAKDLRIQELEERLLRLEKLMTDR